MSKRDTDTAEIDAGAPPAPPIRALRARALEALACGEIDRVLAPELAPGLLTNGRLSVRVCTVLATLPLTLEQFVRLEALGAPLSPFACAILLHWQSLSMRRAPFAEPLLLALAARTDDAVHAGFLTNMLVSVVRAGSMVIPPAVIATVSTQCNRTLAWASASLMVKQFTDAMVGYTLVAAGRDVTRELPMCFLDHLDHVDASPGYDGLQAMVRHHEAVGQPMTWLRPACRRMLRTKTDWLVAKLNLCGRGLVTRDWIEELSAECENLRGDELYRAAVVLQTLRALVNN